MATNFDPKKYDWKAGYQQAQEMLAGKKSFYYSKTDEQRKQAALKTQNARMKMQQMGTPSDLVPGKGNDYSKLAKDYLSRFRTNMSASTQANTPTPYQPYSAPADWGADVDPRATTNWAEADKINKGLLNDQMKYANDPEGWKQAYTKASERAKWLGIDPQYIMPNGQTLGQSQDWMKKFTESAGMWQGQPNTSASSWTTGQINNNLDAMTNMNNPMWDSYKQMANSQGTAAYNEQVKNYQKLMSELQNQANQSMDAVNNNVADAEAKLEDTSFQDYLKSRQAMSNRGLTGTGLADDANTRLQLDRTRQMAGIQRDANAQANKIQDTLNTNQTEAMQKMAATNMQDMINDLFMEYQKTGSENALKAAQEYQKMLKEMMPYEQMTKDQEADFAIANGKLQLDASKLELAKLVADRDYSLDLSKQMGYLVGMDGQPLKDSNGNLISTVEKLKLDETIRNNQFNNQLEASKLAEVIRNNTFNNQVDWAKVEETVRNNQFNNELDARKLDEIIRNNTFNNEIDWKRVEEEIRNNMFNNQLGQGKLDETIRSNKASEQLKQQSIDLDAQELVAKVTQWAEENKLASRGLDIKENEFAEQMDIDRANLDIARDRLIRQKDKDRADTLNTQINHLNRQIEASIKKNGKASKGLLEKRDKLLDQVADLYSHAPMSDSGSYGSSGGGYSTSGFLG
jgi:hypothetical protein